MRFKGTHSTGFACGTGGEVEWRGDRTIVWYPGKQVLRRWQLVGDKWVAYPYQPAETERYGEDDYRCNYAAVATFPPGLYELTNCAEDGSGWGDKRVGLLFYVIQMSRSGEFTRIDLIGTGRKEFQERCARGWFGDEAHRYDPAGAAALHEARAAREEAREAAIVAAGGRIA